MNFTIEQERIFKSAIELLEPIAEPVTKKVNNCISIFLDKNEEHLDYEHCCDNDDCIKAVKKKIRKQVGKKIKIDVHWTYDNGDHDKFNRCEICDCYTHSSLTWLGDEIEHFESNLDGIPSENQAFELISIFESTNWFCDGRRLNGVYTDKHDEVGKRAVALAEKVIGIFSSSLVT